MTEAFKGEGDALGMVAASKRRMAAHERLVGADGSADQLEREAAALVRRAHDTKEARDG